MRNSNTMAIAPTATIANISGVYPCTEPAFKNIYMKENLSGNFIVINKYLVDDLVKLNLWDSKMISRIKLNNGSIEKVDGIPESLKKKYKETFEINMDWLIDAAASRSKWIDQSASTNIFMATKSGKELSDAYMRAWEKGLKTTYYLRTLGASQVTKATLEEADDEKPEPKKIVATPEAVASQPNPALSVMMDADCEACQ